MTANKTLTSGRVWMIDSTYTVPSGKTLTIQAGSIIKYAGYWNTGIEVDSGGTLNVSGTSISTVNFSSAEDDTLGGDSTGDGVTSGVEGNYTSAISVNGGTVNVTFANFKYATTDVGDISATSGGALGIVDSSFSDSAEAVVHYGGSVSMQRNTFSVNPNSDGAAVDIEDNSDLTGVVLSGSNQNTFNGSGPAVTLMVTGTIPVGSTWTIANSTNVILKPSNVTVNGTLNLNNAVTYAYGPRVSDPYDYSAFIVNGTLNIAAGDILKSENAWGSNVVQVNSNGVLNVNGTSSSPVTFTAAEDDSVGGDITGDGSSTANDGAYSSAITSGGGDVNITYANFKYAIYDIWSTGEMGGSLNVSDSSFTYSGAALWQNGGEVSLVRNTFDGSGSLNGAIINIVNADDLSGVVMDGSDQNVFINTNGSTVMQVSGTIPVGSTWVITNPDIVLNPTNVTVNGALTLANGVTYISGDPSNDSYGFIVNGNMTVAAGSIIKIKSPTYSMASGIQVNNNGVLETDGTTTEPVIFTSAEDDTVGGDVSGDGVSSGSVNDYGYGINVTGGTATINNVEIKYASIALVTLGGETTVAGGHFNSVYEGTLASGDAQTSLTQMDVDNASVAIYADGNSNTIFRGSFGNISDKYIRACDWAEGCGVDAAYNDWGSSDGPLNTDPDNNLICGAVTFMPWVHGGTTYSAPNPDLYDVRNCDNSQVPTQVLDGAISAFQSGVDSQEIDCSNGYQGACDAITTAYTCLSGAMNAAQSTTPWPLPGSSTASDVNAFGGLVRSSAATYMTSQEIASPSSFGLSFFNDLVGIAGTMVTLANAYNSCVP